MVTRAKAGIFKPNHQVDLSGFLCHWLSHALFASSDPIHHTQAMSGPKWVHAMHMEMDDMYNNNTLTLVPCPDNHNVVGCKWLFRTKYRADGSIERHKGRFMA
ncbi:uncharacterized mitochondrial protein AtMg00820-like [Lactuca sativa]|uniref:uncharacterized mitochondrial protein AtMg00820-like n=1 Tax=Lactuca sativa TaxID=4236 RepID=UPI000CD9B18F|nr:uncharacterized mitochondrial protein AtMg00820-like [Lactuca sativa]